MGTLHLLKKRLFESTDAPHPRNTRPENFRFSCFLWTRNGRGGLYLYRYIDGHRRGVAREKIAKSKG